MPGYTRQPDNLTSERQARATAWHKYPLSLSCSQRLLNGQNKCINDKFGDPQEHQRSVIYPRFCIAISVVALLHIHAGYIMGVSATDQGRWLVVSPSPHLRRNECRAYSLRLITLFSRRYQKVHINLHHDKWHEWRNMCSQICICVFPRDTFGAHSSLLQIRSKSAGPALPFELAQGSTLKVICGRLI